VLIIQVIVDLKFNACAKMYFVLNVEQSHISHGIKKNNNEKKKLNLYIIKSSCQ